MRYLLLLVLLASCGKNYPSPETTTNSSDMVPVSKPTTCTVTELSNGALITCPDGSSTKLTNGQSVVGETGSSGVDGTNCSVEQTESGVTINCGETTACITNGSTGPQGVAGVSIVPVSSTITSGRADITQCDSGTGVVIATQTGRDLDIDGILDEILDSNVTFVCDGKAGQNGVTSIVYKPIEILKPCGNGELLLKLDDTTLIGVYYDKKNSYLSMIEPGTWVTTTGNKDCVFTVTNDYQIVRQ